MRRLSRYLSVLGLLIVAAGIVWFVEAGPDGARIWHWERLLGAVVAAVACFVAAGWLGRRAR